MSATRSASGPAGDVDEPEAEVTVGLLVDSLEVERVRELIGPAAVGCTKPWFPMKKTPRS